MILINDETFIEIVNGFKTAFTAQKIKFSIKFSKETADLVTFTEEILNGKLRFLCSVF